MKLMGYFSVYLELHRSKIAQTEPSSKVEVVCRGGCVHYCMVFTAFVALHYNQKLSTAMPSLLSTYLIAWRLGSPLLTWSKLSEFSFCHEPNMKACANDTVSETRSTL